MNLKKSVLAMFFIALPCYAFAAEENESKEKKEPTILKGVASYIVDGDRFILQGEEEQYFIRLKGIDAPNDGQALNEDARRFLSDLIEGREVTVISPNGEVNGCYYGEVVADVQNYNIEMLSAGYANIQKNAPKDYIKTAVQARNEKRGIWNEDTRVERGAGYITSVEFANLCDYEDESIVDYKTEKSLEAGRENDRFITILLNLMVGGLLGFLLAKGLNFIDDPRIAIASKRKKQLKEENEKAELDDEK